MNAPAQLVGQFYLDQPARTGKRGGAWMDDVRARWLRPDTGATANAQSRIWCATLPTVWAASRALLTHDDVTTLFHEFGHGLHHMLTQVSERDVSWHQRRRVGRGGAAEPVYGEFLLGVGCAHST